MVGFTPRSGGSYAIELLGKTYLLSVFNKDF
jgi:hypothetical protein